MSKFRLNLIPAFILLHGLARPIQAASTETVLATTSPVESSSTITPSTTTVSAQPKQVRALHVTSWMAGSKKYRQHLNDVFKTTVVNSVIIDVKEYEGEVYIPGVAMAQRAGAYVPAMPDIGVWLSDLKRQGIYTVARIVVFKDNVMPRKNNAFAVKTAQGGLWLDHHNITWLDPYSEEAGRYNLLIAFQAAKLGFDEVQFDYIRFPTDGALSQMRFSKPYKKEMASVALVDFLRRAHQLLAPTGVKVSIDVFGLTTSVKTGMGIGQLLEPMAAQVDYVCPMVYPSHYARGEYGLPNPNDQPYRTVTLAMHDAIRMLGPANVGKLRPYFQDFSLKGRGIRYGKKEIRAQLQAAADAGVNNWALWNARCAYTLTALQNPVVAATTSTVVASSAPPTLDVK